MEKKTIEEVAAFNRGYIAGAKNQSEQMYSSKDLLEAFEAGEKYGSQVSSKGNFTEWFEQFKKK